MTGSKRLCKGFLYSFKGLKKIKFNLNRASKRINNYFFWTIPGWRWSPINLRYKQWGGIYRKGKQILNVNTGIGFIGFPGRIGMPPEVGVITLTRKV